MRLPPLLILALATLGAAEPTPADRVDPLIGTDSSFAYSHGNTNPAALMPFPMTAWAPQTADVGNWFYQWPKTAIQGIRSSHQPSVWIGDYACLCLMPTTGAVEVDAVKRASPFSHARESAKPWRYAVELERYGISAEVAPTVRCAIFRFTFPASEQAHLLIDTGAGGGPGIAIDRDARRVSGVTRSFKPDFPMHFVLEFDRPVTAVGTWTDGAVSAGSLAAAGTGKARVGAILDFATRAGEVVTVRIGTSFIDAAQAARNLAAEIPGWDFDGVARQGRETWNRELGRFAIDGGSDAQRTVFATALYRALSFPHCLNEPAEGGGVRHFSPFDRQVHVGSCYTDNGYWDTFRAQYPLVMSFFPERGSDIVNGLINAWREGGWMPMWPGPGYVDCMIGTHADSVIADALAKGVTGFDVEAAYQAMARDGTVVPERRGVGRQGLKPYLELGYVPADAGVAHSAARTLEYAYDDWCIAQVAGRLGKADERKRFLAQSQAFTRLFDASTGFMRGRNADGSWLEPFDPVTWGEPYIEGAAWHYTWSVQHDPHGLAALYGGRAGLAAKLDAMMAAAPDFKPGSYRQVIHEMREFADAKMGQYAHINEPAHHVLYLWLFAGQPWKTQYWVREVMDRLYRTTPDGLCGDEDTGQMSAWYVWSALGLYPFCPGHPSYVIGSPLFPRVAIAVGSGRTFTVVAEGNSPANRYIQSATLDGKTFTRTWLSHGELMRGGTLALVMGPQPNERWGCAEADGLPPFTPPTP